MEGRPALRLIEGGRERAYPPLLRLNGEVLRLRQPVGTPRLGLWLAGDWGAGAQPVSVRLVPRVLAPHWPGLLQRMQACGHGAVPRVLAVDRWEDHWCAVLEPLHGTNLALRLATGRPPSRPWCFRLLWQLAQAVLSAHECGLASGFLQETDIWLTSEKYLKLPEWSDTANWAQDCLDLLALSSRLKVDLPASPGEWLPWFERKARRLSVYEPI